MTAVSPRRVAVTGMGAVSALGNDCGSLWRALEAGKSGIKKIESVDVAGLRFQNGAEVCGLDLAAHFPPKSLEEMDRFTALALLAAREAAGEARIGWTPALRRRTAVVTGTATGGGLSQDRSYVELYRNARPRVHPMSIPRAMHSASAGWISMEFGLTGPALAVATACASSTQAIGLAFWLVRQGAADIAIAGGSESPFHYGLLKAWEALRVVAPDTCRPFSRGRAGMILGEGAAILVLEPLEHARTRGAEVLAEIAGFGMSSDAGQLLHPCVEGAVQAMKAALDDADAMPNQIQFVNAHGTGTVANDEAESMAIQTVFGAHARSVAVTSTKAAHGHALGAAGAIEAVATVLSLRHGIVPPTQNFLGPDPGCDVQVVTDKARTLQVDMALSNSFAFGGHNASLLFKR